MKTNNLAILFLFISIMITSRTNAQESKSPISKGSKVLGIKFDLSNATKELYESSNGDNLFNADFSGGMSYFLADRFEIGADLRIISYKYTTKVFQIGIQSEAAYFLGKKEREKIQGSVYPFAAFAVNYFFENRTDADGEKAKAKTLSIGPAVGLTIMLSNSVAFSGRLGYMFDRKKFEDGDVMTGRWISPQMGIVFFLYDRGNSMF